jgi:uncharacterized membrane protein YecN with MAPEG domain
MAWVELVTLLAIGQFIFFGLLVGRARMRHQVPAPAMSGHEIFDRYFRVHMNTLETLMGLLPSMWIAAQYWSPGWCAAIGAVHLVGRQVYLKSYVADPKKRSMGYSLSFLPVAVLLVAALVGIARSLLRGS